MAYSYTFPNTGITFTNLVNTPTSGQFGTKHGRNIDYQYANEDGAGTFFNAVEIDWNNAQRGAELIHPIGEARCSKIVPMGCRRFAII